MRKKTTGTTSAVDQHDEFKSPQTILSQKDFNDILCAFGGSEEDSVFLNESSDGPRVLTYDFRRPDCFSKDQIMTIQMIHEIFARSASLYLSERMNTSAEIHVAAVDQMTWGEFTRSLHKNTLCAVLGLDYSGTMAGFEIDSAVTGEIIDTITKMNDTSRIEDEGFIYCKKIPVSPVESALMEPIIQDLTGILRTAWKTLWNIKPFVKNVTTDPHSMRITAANEICITITFHIVAGKAEGFCNICFPFSSIVSLLPLLSVESWMRSFEKDRDARVSNFDLDVSISINGGAILYKDICLLKKGSHLSVAHASDAGFKPSVLIDNEIILSNDSRVDNFGTFDIPKHALGKNVFERNFSSVTRFRLKTLLDVMGMTQSVRRIINSTIRTLKAWKTRKVIKKSKNALSEYLAKLDITEISGLSKYVCMTSFAIMCAHLDKERTEMVLATISKVTAKHIRSMLDGFCGSSPDIEYAMVKGIRQLADKTSNKGH